MKKRTILILFSLACFTFPTAPSASNLENEGNSCKSLMGNEERFIITFCDLT